ncbi:scavenger receptor class F member 1 [Engraulis encrasicolus]|uniref:scavenger receptor class F member 1 n=1 Tax=Engraulis encrasicolus TaxID=184585 RepID=UPI002FD3BA38
MGFSPTVLALLLYLGYSLVFAQKLSSTGRNVCLDRRDASSLVCCNGWRQQGEDCTIPVCEGERACQQDEVCVYPGMCRCRPGYYGPDCKTSCPPEYWGSDCREFCLCHPHGTCDPATGECTCLPNRWGPLCQHECTCGRHGRCHPLHGNCTCEEGWWTPTCSKMCQCFHQGTARCDAATGHCACNRGFWGLKCSLRCNCYISACDQGTGHCRCDEGWWGPGCDRRCNCDFQHATCDPSTGDCLCDPGYKNPVCHEPCGPGYYGRGCQSKCGQCLKGDTCNRVNGSCAACNPGWNGTRCDQLCPSGLYGDRCSQTCPPCRNQEACSPVNGECTRCNPGRTGPRCDKLCPEGRFGEGCRYRCGLCIHGHCDPVTGSCLCQSGFQGHSCNDTCPDHLYGANCSSACHCTQVACHPETGACLYSTPTGLIVGMLLLVLFLLLMVCCCCCCCCGQALREAKESVPTSDDSPALRMKHQVYSVLATVSSAVPCISLWSSGLPRVTVSHHDPELTFNHSFIEPPSSGWITENSFETDEEEEEGEEGEALYCVPPREDISTLGGGQFQELSSKCNMFPDPSSFSSEDMSLAFGIPRTSSIAKSKRPSVSFAEGTKFSPQELPAAAAASATATTTSTAVTGGRKPKSPWGVLMVSALQGLAGEGGGSCETGGERELTAAGAGGEIAVDEHGGVHEEEEEDRVETAVEYRRPSAAAAAATAHAMVTTTAPAPAPARSGSSRRRTLSNPTKRNAQAQDQSSHQLPDGGSDKVTTVYVTVGKASRGTSSKPDGCSSEGPVQAMLRRLGSIQRQREEAGSRLHKARGEVAAVVKPPRRKLGTRAAAWEQALGGLVGAGSGGGGGEGSSQVAAVPMRKPSRRKQASLSSPPGGSQEGTTTTTTVTTTPKRPLSSILKSVPERGTPTWEAGKGVQQQQQQQQRPEPRDGACCSGGHAAEDGYLTVGPPAGNMADLGEVIANDVIVAYDDNGPQYENVMHYEYSQNSANYENIHRI